MVFFLLAAAILAGAVVYWYGFRSGGKPVKSGQETVLLAEKLKKEGLLPGDPVFIRIIKEPKELELWMKPAGESRYRLVHTYPIQAMSGTLGPKTMEGDKQAPEGYYRTFFHLLNPNSKYHLSFNIGYPNAYDKSLSRTGSFIMVHGGAKSIGCFAMGDPAIEEIYGLSEAYLKTRQGKADGIPVQVYPFVPAAERMAREKGSPHYEFWSFLKKGWDYTERTALPAPVVFTPKGEMRLAGTD